MRLTQYDREAFVRSAMEDVPQIDFDVKAQKLINEHLKEVTPVDLQNTIAKYPDWFEAKSITTPSPLHNFATRLIPDVRNYRNLTHFPKLLVKVEEIAKEKAKQTDVRYGLEQKLRGAIGSCSTLKAATELLPEFVKYLPSDRDGVKTCRQMPVIANLVTDLMNAGWTPVKPSV